MKEIPGVAELTDRLQGGLGSRYALEHREIGRGGMSFVYRARDLRHGRDVAVKVLRPELAATVAAERFLQEIRIAAQLQHPHILPLHDSGEADGLLYYIMPYVEGESLRQRLLREKQFTIPDALRIAVQIADALSYAHGRGVVHRDIKPENIMFSSGQAMLSDFGIARAIVAAGGERVTETGLAVGTVGYMSPEQADGQVDLDGRSDVYSLACVLYEVLAGETPYTGPSGQAIIAKHMRAPVPSIRTVRDTVPPQLDDALRRALAKVPADRFATAQEFADALRAAEGARIERTALSQRPTRRRLLLAITVGITTLWLALRPEQGQLDPHKIVVFPLIERGVAAVVSGTGYDVALMIGAALEHSEPLKWIDGWQYLEPGTRANPGLLPAAAAQAITRRRGARYSLEGAVRSDEHTTAVVLRLHDALGDSLIAQETATAAVGTVPVYQLGLTAVRRLLPKLLDPGRAIELEALTDRRPAAIALWIQGEREYRRSRFGPALDFYQRAVREDSALAFAAVKGAEAANWMTNRSAARTLLTVALAHEATLPRRYRYFARGLEAYLTGRADTAVAWLERALREDPEWPEASMVLGDVFYHFFPSRAPLDSLAVVAFDKALADDSSFTPPILHLVEIAARRGEATRARFLLERLRQGDPDSTLARQLTLMVECIERGPGAVNWHAAARGNVNAVLFAAKGLSVGMAQPECGQAGFRAILAHDSAPPSYRWGALLGLQGVLAAQRRTEELVTLLDSAASINRGRVLWLHVFNVEAGVPLESDVAEWEAFERARLGEGYEGAEPHLEWLLGVWHSRLGNTNKVEALHASLASRLTAINSRRTRLLAEALGAHLTLARGDTAAAIDQFRALAPNASTAGDTLQWHFWESLPVERLKLARLLLARGQYEEAHLVASAFDHQEPVAYLPFVLASLSVRMSAAQELGRSELVSRYRTRLVKLGQVDLAALP